MLCVPGITPLHIATMNSDTAAAKILTKFGADPTVPVSFEFPAASAFPISKWECKILFLIFFLFQDSVHGLTPLAMAKQAKLETFVAGNIPKKSIVEIPSR